MRLRRSDTGQPGFGRRGRGRGFSYLDVDGRPLTDPDDVRRCRELVIPPAWTDVWICPDPAGHLQATGVDVAGRRQYLYHDQWSRSRSRRKFAHVLDVAGRLPRLRRRISADLGEATLSQRRVLALAARLVDLGLFRIGGDEYAGGDDPTFGVATLRADHVRCGQSGRRTVAGVMRQVAEDLGNTSTVARKSYVDPQVIELYLRGQTIQLPPSCPPAGPAAERAVLDLLTA